MLVFSVGNGYIVVFSVGVLTSLTRPDQSPVQGILPRSVVEKVVDLTVPEAELTEALAEAEQLESVEVSFSQTLLSLVELLHYCALIGGEPPIDEIFSC